MVALITPNDITDILSHNLKTVFMVLSIVVWIHINIRHRVKTIECLCTLSLMFQNILDSLCQNTLSVRLPHNKRTMTTPSAQCATYHPWLSKFLCWLGPRKLLNIPMNGCCWLVGTPCYCKWGTNLYWPDYQTWTKTDINQSNMGICGHVSDFLGPNRCRHFC